jgi:hypothetical protein
MIKLDSGNVLLKPSQRRQLMAWLRRSLKLGERLGNFVLSITMWRSGRHFELRAAVRDGAGDFGCRVRRNDWQGAMRDLVQTVCRRLHGQCLQAAVA